MKLTPAFRFGQLAHSVVLEPQTIHGYVAKPQGLRRGTKAYAAFEEENKEKIIVDESELTMVKEMVDRIYSSNLGAKLLKGEKENSIWWKPYEDQDFLSRCRPDVTGDKILVDLKFVRDVSKGAFAASANKYNYDMQAAYYLDGANAISNNKYEQFIFLAVEKEAPYRMAYYVWDELALATGRNKYHKAIQDLTDAQKEDSFSWGDEQIETIGSSAFVDDSQDWLNG